MRIRISSSARRLALAFIALALVSATQAQTYTFSTLYSFKNNATDPNTPNNLTIDAAGNLYGTSVFGGTHGNGTIFKVTPAGALSVLYNFTGGSTDGGNPASGVTRDSAGNLYGSSGSNSCGNNHVYKLSASGKFTNLHSFTGGSDGCYSDQLVLDSAGNMYGAAQYGTTLQGLIFKINSKKVFSILYNFCSLPNCADGSNPNDPIVDNAGNIYGSTYGGGTNNNGTVYKLTTAGVETVLYDFAGGPADGSNPFDQLKRDSAGTLYGVTQNGGTAQLFNGVLFKVPEAGGEDTVLHDFCSSPKCADGSRPLGQVLEDKAGNLFGVTLDGSANEGSIVWEVTPASKEIVLYTFPRNVNSLAGLTMDSAGNLYGTNDGGTDQRGTVFKLTLVK